MRTLSSNLVVALALALALGGSVAGCDEKAGWSQAPAAAAIPELTTEELASALAKGGTVPVDCNGAQLRQDVGVIPGAIKLSDYEAFSLSELPPDKDTALAFYCANEQCDASHVAARRARSAGYARVHVLPAGIFGWSKAGQLVDKPGVL